MIKTKIWASIQRIIKLFTQKFCHEKYGFGIRDPEKNLFWIPDPGTGVKKAPDPGSGSATLDFHIQKIYPGVSFNTFWNTEMPHLDKHWIAGVLVGLELFAVSVEEDGLGP
jgi:hypothetical protein